MLLKPADLARSLSCSTKTIRRAAIAGWIDHLHVGRDFRFREEALEMVLTRGVPGRADKPRQTRCPRCRVASRRQAT